MHSQRTRGPLWHRVRIERRVKTIPSILGKFATGYADSWPNFSLMEDIGGVRVICPTTWHVEACVRFFEGSSDTKPLACPLRRYDIKPTVDGYRGVHAIRARFRGSRNRGLLRSSDPHSLTRCLVHLVAHRRLQTRKGRHQDCRRDALRDLSDRLNACEEAAAAIFSDEVAPVDGPDQ